MIKVVDAVREIYVSDTRFVFSLPDFPGDIGTLPVLSRSEIFSSVDNNIVAIFLVVLSSCSRSETPGKF